MSDLTELSPKAIQTRQEILNAALKLFAEKGYEKTTMRDIAQKADCSLGLAYRYFASKDDFVLALYWQFHEEWVSEIAKIKGGSLADRFDIAMRIKVQQLSLYREAMGSLFTTMLNPSSNVGVLSTNTNDLTRTVISVFDAIVRNADNAPNPKQAEDISILLYSSHLLIQLFWLYDRSPQQELTKNLLDFTRDSLTLMRRMLLVPFVSNTLARLASILRQIFVEQE